MASKFYFTGMRGDATLTVTKYDNDTEVFELYLTNTSQIGLYWHLSAAQVTSLLGELNSAGIPGSPIDDATVQVLPFDPKFGRIVPGEGPGPDPAPAAVDLGAAGTFAALGKSGITNVPTSAIIGDIGVSPAAAASITGFALSLDGGGTFSTSAQVTGQVFAADYAAPTPANMTAAISAMEAAYTDASGRAPDVTELNGGDISGLSLAPGVYKWSTGLLMNTDATLLGGPDDVFIFIVAGTFTVAAATTLNIGTVNPANIYWAVAGNVTLGSTSNVKGTMLGFTLVALQANAIYTGRLFSQTSVTLISNTITEA